LRLLPQHFLRHIVGTIEVQMVVVAVHQLALYFHAAKILAAKVVGCSDDFSAGFVFYSLQSGKILAVLVKEIVAIFTALVGAQPVSLVTAFLWRK
jgi:hypothetical protein